MDIAFDMLRSWLETECDHYTCEKTIRCFKSAIFNLNAIEDSLADGIRNPDKWQEDNITTARIVKDFIPLITMSSILHGLPEVESLQEDPYPLLPDI
jgi:hypothetical protein